jgi:hypothetical protein
MCGRVYQTYTDAELYFQYLNKRPQVPLQFTPVYNLCPTQNSPVLRLVDGERQFDQMRWQLVPNWESAFTTKLSTINATSETVFGSPLFGELVSRQRCIVPISGMPYAAYHLLCRASDYAESVKRAIRHGVNDRLGIDPIRVNLPRAGDHIRPRSVSEIPTTRPLRMTAGCR